MDDYLKDIYNKMMDVKNNYLKYIYDRMVKEDLAYIAIDSSAYEKYTDEKFFPYHIPTFTDYNTKKEYHISMIYLPTLSKTLGKYSIKIVLCDNENEIYEIELLGKDFDFNVLSNLAWLVFKETEEENQENYYQSLVFGAVFDE